MKDFTSEFKPIDLAMHGVRLPSFSIEDKYKKELSLESDVSNLDFLKALCRKGFKKLGVSKDSDDFKKYSERAKHELSILNELGFVDYILLVWDVINFCRENNIPVGLGRGSAAGSLVLYLIGVTRVNPIKYGLYFERFVSKARAKKQVVNGITYLDGSLMCDVDMDICYYNRHKVLEYLENKFKGKTSKILTLNTLSGKLLMKECGKIVASKSEVEMNEVTAMLPKLFGQVKDIEEAYGEVEEFKNWCDTNSEVYKIALKLRNLIKNKGVHPSGVLLSHGALDESCPTELSSDKDPVSSFDMNWVSLLNVKLDILGLRSVSVVDDACKGVGISVEDIDFDDPIIYQSLQDLKNPHGLFQIEADTNYRVCRKVKPKNLEELSAVLAISRPGALSFADQYEKFSNYQQIELPDVESEKLKTILSETGGCILFQETLMKIAYEVFELSLDQAELIRKACGKKKREEMSKFEDLILAQGKKLNIPKSAQFYWNSLIASADYSFNKCLSPDTSIEVMDGFKLLHEIKKGEMVKAFDVANDKDHFVEVLDIHENEVELFEVELEDGRKIKASLDHKFLCEDKAMRPLKEIIKESFRILTD